MFVPRVQPPLHALACAATTPPWRVAGHGGSPYDVGETPYRAGDRSTDCTVIGSAAPCTNGAAGVSSTCMA